MYKNLLIIFSAIALLLVLSCSVEPNYTVKEINGVKHYYNKAKGTEVVNIDPVKLFEIDGTDPSLPDSSSGFEAVTKIITDYNENIYVLDKEKAVIKKYNNSGKFDKLIGNKGKNVEHFFNPTEMALMYDTLVVYDENPRRFIRYLTNGTYISAQILMSTNTPQYMTSDGKTNLASFQSVKYVDKSDSLRYMNNDICILSDRFKVTKVIKEIKYAIEDPDFFIPDMFTTYFQKDGNFYIANNESDSYSIEVKNSRGNMQYVIEKEYEKLPYNSYEVGQMNEFISRIGGSPVDTTKTYYKKAVNMIYVDKYDRIWALPSLNRTAENETTHYVDLFKDGVFLNRIILDVVGRDESFLLSGNRLYVTNDVTKKISVYEY
ncbi:MAG: hypothetical protein JXR69_03815 [Candidatus Delongbacteria bacterium]|nr:hypothetical protein [Candidatus Delongbacteria bacterium]